MATIGEILSGMDVNKEQLQSLKMQNQLAKEKMKHLDLLDQIAQRAGETMKSGGGGNPLVDLILQGQFGTGDLSGAMKTLQTVPEMEMQGQISGMLGGGVQEGNLQPGAQPAGQGMSTLAALVEAGGKGDPEALAKIAAIKQATDLDLTQLVNTKLQSRRTMERRFVDPQTKNEVSMLVNRFTGEPIPGTEQTSAPGDITWQTIRDPGGAEVVVPYWGSTPMIPVGEAPGGLGATPGAIPTGFPETEQDIPMSELSNWRNPETFETLPAVSDTRSGISPDRAEAMGFVKLSPSAVGKVESLRGLEATLSDMAPLIDRVFPEKESVVGGVIGGIGRTLSEKAQTRPDAVILSGLLATTLPQMIRAMSDSGSLPSEDAKQARSLVPKLTDRADVARRKFDQLQSLFSRVRQSLIGKAKKEVPKPVQSMQRKPGETIDQYLKRTGG